MARITLLPIALTTAIAGIAPLSPSFFQDQLLGKSSQQLGLCTQFNPPTIKRGQDLPINPPVCPFNIGPYWQICGDYPYEMAADACAAYGWRLASLTQENAEALTQVIGNCSNSISWVAAIDGLAADPCAFAVATGFNANAFQNFGTVLCGLIPGAVLCEEMPQVTVSQTETLFNMTITFGQTTTTTTSLTTRTVRPYHPQCSDCSDSSSGSTCWSSSSSCESASSSDCSCDWTSDSSCSSSSSSSSSSDCECPRRGRLHHKMLKSNLDLSTPKHRPHPSHTGPICYGQNCLPICNATVGGIHLITAAVNYTDAAAECAKYGWSVLDFTTERVRDVSDLVNLCFSNTAVVGWINSFNGVKSACQIVQATAFGNLFPSGFVGKPGRDEWCEGSFPLPVFCQEQCPFQVAESGSETGQVSLTTELSFTTATLFTPSTTVVVRESCTESVFIN